MEKTILVRAKVVKNSLFTPMVIVSVLKANNGAHIYNAQTYSKQAKKTPIAGYHRR